MSKQEFYEKFGLHFEDIIKEYAFLGALDKLYLEFTKEQAIQILECFYENADDIFNEAKEEAEQIIADSLRKLIEALNSLDENNDEEDENLLDKVAKA